MHITVTLYNSYNAKLQQNTRFTMINRLIFTKHVTLITETRSLEETAYMFYTINVSCDAVFSYETGKCKISFKSNSLKSALSCPGSSL